jgi:adenylate cyclase class IV
MPNNVEIKARASDLQELERRAAELADSGPTILEQEDVFFESPEGRLKLRIFPDGGGELIYYDRPDRRGP